MKKLLVFLLLNLCTTLSMPAVAYVGPGAGITMLGALWAVVVAIITALIAVLYWPIRAVLRRRRRAREKSEALDSNDNERVD